MPRSAVVGWGDRVCACLAAWCEWDTASAIPGGADQRFHVIEIPLERAAPAGGETILCLGHPPLERLGARDIVGFLELARVDAQVAVRRLHQLFQVAEAEGIIHGERADNSEPQTLVNEPVEGMGAPGSGLRFRLAPDRAQSIHASSLVITRRPVLSHRASARCDNRTRCEGPRKRCPLSSRSMTAEKTARWLRRA